MIDIGDKVYNAFYDWIPTRIGSTIPVIRKRPNAPAPAGHYLVIDDNASLQPFGRTSQGYRSSTDFQSKVQDWIGSVALWEVGARTAALTRLVAELDLNESIEYFSALGISILRPEPIVPMPSLEDSDWTEQYRVEIPFAVATGQQDTGVLSIDTISLSTDFQP